MRLDPCRVNEYFEDGVVTPGYREWEAFELRQLLGRFGFGPERNGFWENEEKGLGLVVTHSGIFVGWLDHIGAAPGPSARRLMEVAHLPREFEAELFEQAIADAEANRAAVSVQCRHCGEMVPPSGIAYGRTCHPCAEERAIIKGIP